MLKGKKGFTLIELVVVIAILGILAGIAIPRFLDATATARGAKVVADLRTIDSAIVIFNAKTGKYPAAIANLTASSADGSSYVLLASTPTPPSGECQVTKADGSVNKFTPTETAYALTTDRDRATLDSKTVDAYIQ